MTKYVGGGYGAVYNPTIKPLNEQSGATAIAADDGAVFNGPTNPSGRVYVELAPRDGAITFVVDGSLWTLTAPGYIAADGREFIGPLTEHQLHTVHVYAIEATTLHVYWWMET